MNTNTILTAVPTGNGEREYDYEDDAPEYRHRFWTCNACNAQNSDVDGECQLCECGGLECKRDSCSCPDHFHAEHFELLAGCLLCEKGAPQA